MISDGRMLAQYIEYGYSLFNYLHAFPKNVSDEYPEQLNEIIQKLWRYYDKEDAAVLKTEFHNMSEKHDMLNEIKRETSNEIKQLLQRDLEKYFEDNSLKSHDKFKMILEQFSKETPDWEEIKKYLKRYSKDGDCKQSYLKLLAHIIIILLFELLFLKPSQRKPQGISYV
jgi:hypothetical protein